MEKMIFAILVCVQLFVSLAMNGSQPGRNVEQSLGGLTVGLSTLAEVHSKFGSRLILENGIYMARFEEGCQLSIVLEDRMDMSEAAKVNVLTSQWISGKPPHDSATCTSLTTGKGLHLGATLEDVRRIYGEPTEDAVKENIRILDYSNTQKCRNLSLQTLRRKTMGIWISKVTKRVTEISIDAEKVSCEEFRKYWRENESRKSPER